MRLQLEEFLYCNKCKKHVTFSQMKEHIFKYKEKKSFIKTGDIETKTLDPY